MTDSKETEPTSPDVEAIVITALPMPRGKARFLYAMILVLTLAESWDSTSIVVVIPAIAQTTHANSTLSYALGTSFLLANTIFQPLFAELSHSAGRKPMYLCALALILAGSIIAALSESITQLLAGRIIQGIGAAGGLVLAMIVLADLFPLRERTLYVAGLNVLYTIGSVTGPILGGVFLRFLSWRWVFWINLPLIGAGAVGLLLLPDSKAPENVTLRNLLRVDWVGLLIFMPSSVAFLLPMTFGGVIYPWSSWRIILPLVVSIVGLIVFGCQQRYWVKRPMFPAAIFPDIGSAVFQFAALVQGLLLWLFMYYIVLYLQGVRQLSGVITGVYLLPATLTVAPAAIVSGITINKTRHYRWSVWLGWILTTTGFGLFCMLSIDTRMVEIVFLNIILGLGLGILLSSVQPAAQATLDWKMQPHAIALIEILRSAGQCLGVAIGTAVFSNTLARELAEMGITGETGITAESILQQLNQLGDSGEEDIRLRQAIAEALRPVWITACALGAATWLISGFMRCPPLQESGETGIAIPPQEDREAEGAISNQDREV